MNSGCLGYINKNDSLEHTVASTSDINLPHRFREKQTELSEFDDNTKHYADMSISLDLDEGVKVNYGKFGDLLAEVKAVTGKK